MRVLDSHDRTLELMLTGSCTYSLETSMGIYEVQVTLVGEHIFLKWSYDVPRKQEQVEQYLKQKISWYIANNVHDVSQWKEKDWQI